MTTHEPQQSALAYLARAIDDVEFIGEPIRRRSLVCISPERLAELEAAERAWQSPSRPDAAAFARAVERFGDAEYALGELPMEAAATRKGFDVATEVKNALAALLAFAPSADAATITEEGVVAVMRAEAKAQGWDWDADPYPSAKKSVLEFRLAEFQRADALLDTYRVANGGAHE